MTDGVTGADVNGAVDGNAGIGVNGIVDGVGVVGAADVDVVDVVDVVGFGVFNNNGALNDVIGVGTNENNQEIMLDHTPPIRDVDTPNTSLFSDGSQSDTSLCGSENDSQSSHNDISASDLLKDIRIKNVNRLTIGTLNINFIAPKFEQLKEVIGNHLDIFTIQETKLDASFTEDQ